MGLEAVCEAPHQRRPDKLGEYGREAGAAPEGRMIINICSTPMSLAPGV